MCTIYVRCVHMCVQVHLPNEHLWKPEDVISYLALLLSLCFEIAPPT